MSGVPAPPSPAARAWTTWAVGVLATAAFFAPMLAAGGVFLSRDMGRVHYPVRLWLRQRVLAGELPSWFPHEALGEPLWGALVTGLMHPLGVLELALPFDLGFRLHGLACFVLAFVGARALAARVASPGAAWLAGATFAFSGHLVGMTNNLGYLTAAATLPWALLAIDRLFEAPSRPRLVVAAVALALVAWAGDPLSFAVASGLALPVMVARGPLKWGWLAGLAGLAALLAAAPALPALAIADAAAGGENGRGDALEWSAHPLRLVEWLAGPLFVSREDDTEVSAAVATALLGSKHLTTWALTAWVGAVPVTLALCGASASAGRRARLAWGSAAAVVLLLWLGRWGGLFGALYDALPAFRSQRYPEKLGGFVALGWAVLAARGLDPAVAALRARRVTAWPWFAVGAALAGLLAVSPSLPAWLTAGWPTLPGADAQAVAQNAGRAAAWGLAAWAAGGLAARALPQRWSGPGLAALQFGAAVLTLGGTVLWGAPHWAAEVPDVLRGLPLAPGERLSSGARRPRRLDESREALIAAQASTLEPDAPAPWGFETRDAYLPSASRRVWVLKDFDGFDALFGVRYRYEPERVWRLRPEPRPPVVARVPAVRSVLTRLPDTAPRLSLARARCVPDAEAARDAIARPDFHGGDEAVVECAAPREFPAQVRGQVREVARTSDSLAVDVEGDTGGLLVVNEAWYPGWEAFLDDAPAPVLVANAAVRGVEVPVGHHRVRFQFHHPGLRAGLALTGLGALISALLAGGRRRRE